MQYHIGCSGWSYSAWLGPFYPSKLENSDWLRYYSQIFDYVEIDSSFYRMPSKFMVKNWAKKTPNNFRFTAKFPKVITHDKHLVDVNEEVYTYLSNMEPLQEKTIALLIQLPPSMQIMPGLQGLKDLVRILDGRFRYAVEVRHPSWFQDLAYNFFANNDICMVWSQLARMSTPPIVTSDFLYVRFIGDRSINEKDFGKIQKDRIIEMKQWADKIKQVESGKERGRNKEVNLAMIAANNHYAGFGPGTANLFRKMVGLPELSWEDQLRIQEQVRFELRQEHQAQQSGNPTKAPPKNTKKRQSSLVEFMG
ncbi:MAG TPA: DUF72 domain-containing protein [Nitrososphaeraceae archaeon]|nr:DUF72 domain-containing protein [Nitrososphaeraceae archaeon]